jgi:uncharacterized protein DUF4383
MQSIQRVATYSGLAFIAASALGFLAAGNAHAMMSMPGMATVLDAFPMNGVHNGVHMAFGVWGLWAGTTRGRAIAYALGSGAAYVVLAIAGLLSPTLFGLMPIGGYDIALHFVLAVVIAGAGMWAAWLSPQGNSRESKTTRRAA